MRTILHSDCNNFYASVECAFSPELRGKPIAVGGDPKARHGIVLAKSDAAKKYGVRTGETLWEAKQKCPQLIVLPPCGEKYLRSSRIMRGIYEKFSDHVEAFGLDESWLDVSGSLSDGVEIASRLRQRAKEELGITLSVGVSFNKIFAKLGSDLHKPDATTVISAENYRQKIWSLPAEELLFIGRATVRKLHEYGLRTIGDIARTDVATLRALLGKNGDTLYAYAAGLDETPVMPLQQADDIQSIGNSTTPAFDIADLKDAQRVLYLLADSVAERLRKHALRAQTVTLSLRDAALHTTTHQMQLAAACDLSLLLYQAAVQLLHQTWDERSPLRSLGIQCGALVSAQSGQQLSVFTARQTERQTQLEKTLDYLHAKYGAAAPQRGVLLRQPIRNAEAGGLSAANMGAIHRREI